MSLNLNNENPQHLLQRLSVREKEIEGLKIQNRHLLTSLGELESQNKSHKISTDEIARKINSQLESVVTDMQETLKTSFELIQSTMRGIYQQSQRAEKALEDMSSHSRELELKMNEQRRIDQNFYQDKIFSMIQAFTDRFERQIDVRLKSLSSIELLHTKQNEVLTDVEGMKSLIGLIQKNSESTRGDTVRIERNSSESVQKLVDVIVQTQNTEELVRDVSQQIENHRNEFKLIRSDLKTAIDLINRAGIRFQAKSFENSQNENELIDELLETKHKEIEQIENKLNEAKEQSPEDAALVLSLLRSQKSELNRVAKEAKNYIKNSDIQDRNTQDRKPLSEVESFSP